MRAALYKRVSTKDKGQDTANQLIQLREFCRVQNWTVVFEYEDYESGGKPGRAGFQKLMLDASQRCFDVVLFWSLDRFSREGAFETLQHLNRLSAYGIGFRSLTEHFLDSAGPFKEAVIAILAAIAKQERVRTSERVCAGLARAKIHGTRSGKPIGRPRAIFHRAEVATLRARGLSWSEIAKTMCTSVSSVRRAYVSRQEG